MQDSQGVQRSHLRLTFEKAIYFFCQRNLKQAARRKVYVVYINNHRRVLLLHEEYQTPLL